MPRFCVSIKRLPGIFFLLAVFGLISAPAKAVDKVWTGASGTSWNTANNWYPTGVPQSGDNVFIRQAGAWYGNGSSSNATPVITTTVTINNLTVNEYSSSGVSLTLNTGANLTVTGQFKVLGTGQFIQNAGTFTHSGTGLDISSSATLTINGGNFSSNASPFTGGTLTAGTARLTFNGGLTIGSGKTYTMGQTRLIVNGNFTMSNSNSVFRSGNDSITINGRLSSNNNTFYGDTAVIIVNGDGTNYISGDFYTNAANITFNPTSFTQVSSGGRFYVNSGTVLFNDSAYIGSNGQLHGGTGAVTFSKSLTVSSNGEINNTSGTITFEGNASVNSSGTINAGAGALNFGGNVSVYSSGVINGENADMNIEGNVSFHNSGTLNAGSGTVVIGGDVDIQNNNGTFNANTSTIYIAGDMNNIGSFNAGTSTVVLNGDSGQTINSDIVFYNLAIETNGTLNAGGNVTVLNDGVIGSNTEISIPDNNDQFEVNGDLVDSSGSLAVATNKPFVTGIVVNSSTEIVVHFNETVTQASAENASNSTWTGRTISSRVLIDSNKLRIQFTPAIVFDTEYTLVFQNIQNTRNPVGTMSAGHEKRFTWTLPSAPATAATSLIFSNVTSDSMTVRWTKGNGARRIVLMRRDSAVSFSPSNGTEYSANNTYGSGTNLGNGQYTVYQGTGDSVRVKGLSAGVTYFFKVVEYNGNGVTAVYQSIAALSGSKTAAFGVPTVQTSNLLTSFAGDTSIGLSWTNGNGSTRIVIARAFSAVNSFPVNNNGYTANASFGSGSEIGTNNFVVYIGTGTSVTVTGLSDNFTYYFTVMEFNGSGGAESYLTTSAPTVSKNTSVRVDIKIFLEGPFNGTDMNASINNVVPTSQVYNTAPWNYSGSESVSSMPVNNVVDWVLVELREASSVGQAVPGTIVGRRAGLLLSSGKIVDLDGVSPLVVSTSRSGRLYVVVYHRTHVPVQSNDSLQRNTNKHIYDFTTVQTAAYGGAAQKEVSTGVYAMYCGRFASSTSQDISMTDFVNAWNERNAVGYYPGDVNMDGVVDAVDRSQIWNNRGTNTSIVQ